MVGWHSKALGVGCAMRVFRSRLSHLALISALLAAMGAAAAHAQQAPQVSGFQAFLFNSETGTLSPDILATDESLGNVPAGPFASVSTFIVVKIDFGAKQPVPANAQVRLVAKEAATPQAGTATRVILDRKAKLGPVATDGTTHVGFWLGDTGCRNITLRATLTAGVGSVSKDTALPFTCYE